MSGTSEPSRDGKPPRNPAGDSAPRRMLEQVLQQTALLYPDEAASDPADLEVLLAVVRQVGKDAPLESVFRELVAAVLRRRVGTQQISDEQFQLMVDRVAQTFRDHPELQPRLQVLWERLRAMV